MNAKGIGMTSERTRDRMIQRLREKSIGDEEVLEAISQVPRHLFIDEALAHRAYEDTALPIQFGQTISQPLVVAQMTHAVIHPERPKRVLELGTGSGYQAAILSQLVEQVFSIERIDKLTRSARRRFIRLGYQNIRCKTGDGFKGWASEGPFDVIICTAAPEHIPTKLMNQLTENGKMILPVGTQSKQQLVSLTKTEKGYDKQILGDVIFVPLLEGVVR